MKKSRFTESQIVAILKEADGGLSVAELKRITELEAEHAKLKGMYADLAMENHALKELIAKKALTPAARQEAAGWQVEEQQVPVAWACRLRKVGRSRWYRPSPDRPKRDAPVIGRLNEIVGKHGRWGFWKCFHWLRQRGCR